MFTDTHCHLYINFSEEELGAVLERAWAAGLSRILIPGIDLETSRAAIRLCERDERLFAAVGVHPNDSLSWTDGTLDALRELAQSPRVVAIGEIGLDTYRDRSPLEQQKNVLAAQLELAAETGLPVILHNRSAWEELWPMLQDWQSALAARGLELAQRPGVLHAFEGTREQAEAAAARNYLISIGGPVTYKNAIERQRLATELNLESLLLETDAPYLTPQQYRGQRNEPAYVRFVAEKIADLRGQDMEFVGEITTRNAARLFRWESSD